MHKYDVLLIASLLFFGSLMFGVGSWHMAKVEATVKSPVVAYTIYNNRGTKTCTALVTNSGRIVGGDCGLLR